MLNYIWSGMLFLGIIWGAFHGRLAQVTEGALNAAGEAVTLSITMLVRGTIKLNRLFQSGIAGE